MPKPEWITPLADAEKVRMALVAGSGFGKTVLCGSAPKALFLLTDMEGAMSAKKFGSTADEWKITSWEDKGGLSDAYIWLRQEGAKHYDWLIHDNATEEQNLGMDRAMEIALASPKGAGRSPFVPDRREYLISQNGFIDLTKKFHSLPIHQIWTVHRKWFEPESPDGEMSAPGYWTANIQGQQGAVAEQFLGYMNIIGHGEVVTPKGKTEEVRRLYFTHYKTFRGKDRFNALGKFKDDLTVPEMMRLINASKDKTVTPRKTTARRRVVRKATA